VVTVPAFVWRGGFFRRALIIGGAVGVSLAALAWIDSGMLLSAIIVFVILGVFYGIWMPRRMARYWPGAKQLSGEERVTVVRTARRGERTGDSQLAQAVIDYSRGIRAAAEQGRPFRWVLPLVLVVGVGMAVWDAVFGSWGNVVASVIYLAMLLIELFWWPKRRDGLLANADRAAELAGQSKIPD
jgi:voltage-gated potassium channel Kch